MSRKSKRVKATKSKSKTVSKRGGGWMPWTWSLSSSKNTADGTTPASNAPTQEKKGSTWSSFPNFNFSFFGSKKTAAAEKVEAAKTEAEAAKTKAEAAKTEAEAAKTKAQVAEKEAQAAKTKAQVAEEEARTAEPTNTVADEIKKGEEMADKSTELPNVLEAAAFTSVVVDPKNGGKKRSAKSRKSRKHRKTNKNAVK
jgi:hypothetical protein